MAGAFVSYSRHDVAFVRRLHAALAAHGRDTWVDWESIPLTAEWEAEIHAGIEAADAFVFVLSPDSVTSAVCARELAHAVRHGKRLVPLVYRPIDAALVPDALAALNWVFCRDGDDFDAAIAALLAAMDTDLARVRLHTRLLVRALEWERKGKDGSFLLRGGDLREAEQWLLESGERAPQPTPPQPEYLVASRRAETARQRATGGALGAGLVVALALAALAWLQRDQAVRAQARAETEQRIAEQQRARAEQRFNDVRQLANSFMFEFHDAIQNLPGATPARRLLVERALTYLDSLAQEAGDDQALQRELLVAYNRVGDVQGNPANANLGDLAGALASYRRSLAIAQRLALAAPGDARALRDLGVGYSKIGEALVGTADTARALESFRLALEIFERQAAADPASARARQDVALAAQWIGDVQGNPNSPNLGDAAAALASYRRSLDLRAALAAAAPDDVELQHDLAVSYTKVGEVQLATGDTPAALGSFQQALAIDERLAAADPSNAEIQRSLAVDHSKIGQVQQAGGDRTAAAASFGRSLTIRERLAAADPDNARARRDLALAYEHLGLVQQASGDPAAALQSHTRALAIREALAAADPANVEAQRDLGVAYTGIGDAQVAAGDAAGALDSYGRALAVDERLATSDPANVEAQRDLAIDHAKIGLAQRAGGDGAGALASRRRMLAILERLASAAAADARSRRSLAFEYGETCWTAALDGLAREVLSECDRAVQLTPEDDAGRYRDGRGLARALAGDAAGAIEDLAAAVEWAQAQAVDERVVATRRAWIASLQAGRSPFDAASLAALRAA